MLRWKTLVGDLARDAHDAAIIAIGATSTSLHGHYSAVKHRLLLALALERLTRQSRTNIVESNSEQYPHRSVYTECKFTVN